MRAQRGQSLAEFAVFVAACGIVPLGMLLVANLHDLQFRSIQAARFVAFDSIWWRQRRTARDAQELLRERLFADTAWRDPWGDGALVDPQSDVRRELAIGAPPGRAAGVTRFVLQPLVAVSGFLGNRFDIDQKGFHSARVHVAVGDVPRLPAPLDSLGIELHEEAAVLGDTWNAADPAHVTRRVSGLVATSLAGEARSLLQPVEFTIALIEPSIRRLCWGKVDPEIVPLDRLAPSTRSVAGLAANSPC